MLKWNKLYEQNKKLDVIFDNKYLEREPFLFKKNCIELIVEICEFANETKCFKYWTNKKTDKEKVLEEFADCMLMTLYFFGYLRTENISFSDIKISNDLLTALNDVISLCTNLIKNIDEHLVKDIFTSLIYISKKFNLSEDDIIAACYRKIKINEERLASNY